MILNAIFLFHLLASPLPSDTLSHRITLKNDLQTAQTETQTSHLYLSSNNGKTTLMLNNTEIDLSDISWIPAIEHWSGFLFSIIGVGLSILLILLIVFGIGMILIPFLLLSVALMVLAFLPGIISTPFVLGVLMLYLLLRSRKKHEMHLPRKKI